MMSRVPKARGLSCRPRKQNDFQWRQLVRAEELRWRETRPFDVACRVRQSVRNWSRLGVRPDCHWQAIWCARGYPSWWQGYPYAQ